MQESEAIAKLIQGDIHGLETLVHKYQVQAVGSAYLITRDSAMAEDIVQSAFIRAYERIEQFDVDRPFGPWFLRSVVNDAVKAVTRNHSGISLDAQVKGGEDTLGDLLRDVNSSLDEVIDAQEIRRVIWEALGKLHPDQRATVVLRYYLGLSETEMAERFTVPPGTIKWRLHTARKRLRQLLQPIWRGNIKKIGMSSERKET